MSDDLAREYRSRFGITVAEWRLLAHLAHEGDGASVRDIEARVTLEKYEVSRTAKRLEESGLVSKTTNASDRRLVSLSLTPKGKRLMSELLPLAQAYQEEIEARLGPAVKGLEAALDRILNPDE
ncbi:MAG: MarR family winged helix-turn-helix transcriptional regulator [Paracoccaceae bacterium]|nr:MarR family winged helix-turn-helix transcriptional regulator [Paracoccaceae bacterium]